MSSLPELVALMGTVCAVLPFLVDRPRSDHEKNVEFLNSLGLRNLSPLPTTPAQEGEAGAASSSTELVSSIEAVQALFDDPKEFLDTTLLSTSEFLLLHSYLEEEITSSRSHRRSASHHQHQRSTRLTSMEQLLLWVLYLADTGMKAMKLVFGSLHKATIYRIADHVTWCVNSVFNYLIAWPTPAERQSLYGLFSICDTAVAVMDGTHCEISKPTYDQMVLYSGYKHKHTQNYLVCVNVLGMVIHVEGPFDGRHNDRHVYNKSEIGRHPARFFSQGEKMLADGGFIGGEPLLVPIHKTSLDLPMNEESKEVLMELNQEFTDNRVLVEDVFGWIKGRAHVLDSRFGRARERQGEAFYSACRLHNFLRIHRMSHAMKQ
jgi:hypothetical protein